MYRIVENLSEATAVILVGGMGTRLRIVVSDRPKALAEIHGRPFLAYLLDQLGDVGIKSVVLCTGYMGDQVQVTFGDAYAGMRLVYSKETSPLGTAGALRLALPLFQSDPVLVMNGDSICRADFRVFWQWHRAHDAQGTVLLTQMPDTLRYGRVQLNEAGMVTGFDEKGKTGPGWINAGIYALTRALIEAVPRDRAVSLEHDMFPLWIGNGLYGYRCYTEFLDIGTPESYSRVAEFLAQG